MERFSAAKLRMIACAVALVLCMSSLALSDANPWFTIALTVWFMLFAYTLADIKKNIVLLCFITSFFVFLLGRELCFNYLGLPRYYVYLNKYDKHTFILVVISLISLYSGYRFAERRTIRCTWPILRIVSKKLETLECVNQDSGKDLSTRRVALAVYSLCIPFAYLDVFLQIKRVMKFGYASTYVSTSVASYSILGYISSFTLLPFCLYLVTLPPKKNSWIALLSYEFYGALTMLTGHRYSFIACTMLCISYVVYRSRRESGWVTKKLILLVVALTPVIIIGMNLIDALRSGHVRYSSGLTQGLISFLDQQGGSVNVIKRIFYYHEQIDDMRFISFSNVRSLLFENAIARKLTDVTVYSGNSVENAFHGHYLSHRLSYLEYGDSYLLGHGVGSSYIAELYFDFGLPGVLLGNILYGFLIKQITDLTSRSYFVDGLLMASQFYIFLAPRGDFDGFIGGVFSVASMLGLAVMWIIIYIIRYDSRTHGRNMSP